MNRHHKRQRRANKAPFYEVSPPYWADTTEIHRSRYKRTALRNACRIASQYGYSYIWRVGPKGYFRIFRIVPKTAVEDFERWSEYAFSYHATHRYQKYLRTKRLSLLYDYLEPFLGFGEKQYYEYHNVTYEIWQHEHLTSDACLGMIGLGIPLPAIFAPYSAQAIALLDIDTALDQIWNYVQQHFPTEQAQTPVTE